MSKYLYPIYKLKTKSYIRWWLYNYLGKFNNYVLSEILTGTSFYLEDSTDRKFNIFDMIGRTTQESTTGANVFDLKKLVEMSSSYENYDNGYTFLVNTSMYNTGVTLDNPITLPASFSYKVKNQTGTNFRIKLWFNDGTNLNYYDYGSGSGTDEKIITFNNITKSGATAITKIGADWSNAGTFSIYDFIINEGSTAISYEPYTGGEPAPNPKYPFPIKNTGDNGSVNENVSNSDGTQEQNIPFPLAEGQKLMEGDYLADDGVHHVMKQWVLDEDNISMVTGYGTGYDLPRVLINKTILGYKSSWETNICLMNRYKEAKKTADIKSGTFSCINGANAIEIYDERFTDLATARNLLIGTVIQIKQVTEVIDPYTEEQKTAWEQIKNLKTYKPVTHISSEDETPAELKIQYWKEV